jgi:hypothetical protein
MWTWDEALAVRDRAKNVKFPFDVEFEEDFIVVVLFEVVEFPVEFKLP